MGDSNANSLNMETSGDLRTETPLEKSTIVIVRNRCQFCYAYFKDPKKIAEHSNRCEFRFSETFEAFDGKVKYACAVCFDVFETRADHRHHERLHKFPGGFPCSICDNVFLNDLECRQHMESTHEAVSTTGQPGENIDFACVDCGAFFELKSYLRLHNETNCGRNQMWTCNLCSPNLLTETAYTAHMKEHHAAQDGSHAVVKVEDMLIEVGQISPFNCVEASYADPLQSTVKEEIDPTTEIDRIMFDNNLDEYAIDHFLPEDNPIENVSNEAANRSEESAATENNLSDGAMAKLTGADAGLPYKCDCCSLYFKSGNARSAHRLETHMERLTCKICNKYFRSLKNYDCHTKSHSKAEKRLCKETGNANISDGVPKKKRKVQKNKPFECNICERNFTSSDGLYRHKLFHGPDGSLVHKCPCCFTYFATAEENHLHMTSVHKDKMKCQICDRSFHSLAARRSHQFKHHRGIKVKKGRSQRGESSGNRASLDTHYQSDCKSLLVDDNDEQAIGANPKDETQQRLSETDSVCVPKKRNPLAHEKKFVCKHCGRRFLTNIGLEKHFIEHGPDRDLVYRCDCCPIYFKTEDDRNAHHLAVHKEKLTCKICNKYCRRSSTMAEHVQKHKRGPKEIFVCVKCGAPFSSTTALDNHERSDCGRLPSFECDICGRFLSSKVSIITHMMIHTDERKFPCQFCGKKFRNTVRVKTHVRYRHSGERPYKCPFCEKRFVELSSMKVHTIIHTGIKRYICYGCGERYPTNSALHKHRNARKTTCALVPIGKPLERTD